MRKIGMARERLSIDVPPQEHRQIKAYAAFHGKTIRDYVLESVRERLHNEAEEKGLLTLTAARLDQDPLLQELWNNDKDAAYDKL